MAGRRRRRAASIHYRSLANGNKRTATTPCATSTAETRTSTAEPTASMTLAGSFPETLTSLKTEEQALHRIPDERRVRKVGG